MFFLQVNNITKNNSLVPAVENISFQVGKGERIAVAGETGSGKTTILKIIAGLIQPDAGEVLLNGERVEGPDEKLLPGHPQIAYLGQHFELRNNYRVEEELECRNWLSEEAAQQLYHLCRISHLLKRKTTELSGGERQRIALARLLTTSPSLLLLDEPFSNLDMPHKQVIKSVIENISETLGITCIMVLHDADDILPWADRVLIMQRGKLIQTGTAQEVYTCPVSEYAAALLGAYNVVSSKMLAQLKIINSALLSDNTTIIRPEEFSLTKQSEQALPAVVDKVSYMGYYTMLELTTQFGPIRVRVKNGQYYPVQTVYVCLKPFDI